MNSMQAEYLQLKTLWLKLRECEYLAEKMDCGDIKTLVRFAKQETENELGEGHNDGLWNYDAIEPVVIYDTWYREFRSIFGEEWTSFFSLGELSRGEEGINSVLRPLYEEGHSPRFVGECILPYRPFRLVAGHKSGDNASRQPEGR